MPLDLSGAVVLGEPKVGAWALTLHVTCPCGETFLWMGVPGFDKPGTVMMCKCRKQYTLIHMPTFADTGQLQVNILHSSPVPVVPA